MLTGSSCCSTLCCSRHPCNTQSVWLCRALCKQSIFKNVSSFSLEASGKRRTSQDFSNALLGLKGVESATKGTVRELKLPKANQNMADCLAFMESTSVHYANLNTLTVFGFMLLIPCTICFLELPSMYLNFGQRMCLAKRN